MTALKARIARLIEQSGPMPVSAYMALCLFDPQHGYYTTREPFGRAGDFVTAPEISQMFGELTAAWLLAAWKQIGAPAKPLLAEIGPGRGALMRDMLRALDRLAPELTADVWLVETSERLAAVQREALPGRAVAWATSLDQLPARPLLLVGNELFDAVPARQFVRRGGDWRERCVGLDANGGLAFAAGAARLDPAHLPPGAAAEPDGAIFEDAPARTAVMQLAAGHIAAHGGAGLFFDYGHLQSGFGDTLQALRKHAFDDPLAHPGEADLTSHVDFEPLAAVVRQTGLTPCTATQGDFLLRLGLLERAGALGAKSDEAVRERLRGEVERLAAPDQMGELFKVLAFASGDAPPPGFG